MALTLLGNTSWRQNAPETWSLTDTGLDQLTVPYDGPESFRTAFQAGLIQWTPSPIDGNMFLAGWSNTDHKHYPRIDLRYIGLKAGRTYSVRETFQDVQQNAVWTNPPDVPDDVTVDITYISRVITAEQIGPHRLTSALGVVSPSDIVEADVIWWEVNGTFDGVPSTTTVLALFSSRIATMINSEEIVPGRLYRNSSSRYKMLFAEH